MYRKEAAFVKAASFHLPFFCDRYRIVNFLMRNSWHLNLFVKSKGIPLSLYQVTQLFTKLTC